MSKKDIHNSCFITGLSGKNGHFRTYVHVSEDPGRILIKTFSPIQADKANILKVAELAARINECVLLGNFILDFEEGTISYKTSIILDETPLDDDMIRHLLLANMYASEYVLTCLQSSYL